MKAYWDTSALVQSVWDADLKQRLETEGAITRVHTLAETFSTLTGNPATRIDADSAARVIEQLATHLEFVELAAADVISALKSAREKGVRGGRVHDLLHAVAAEKSAAKKIVTLDENDFEGLTRLDIELA